MQMRHRARLRLVCLGSMQAMVDRKEVLRRQVHSPTRPALPRRCALPGSVPEQTIRRTRSASASGRDGSSSPRAGQPAGSKAALSLGEEGSGRIPLGLAMAGTGSGSTKVASVLTLSVFAGVATAWHASSRKAQPRRPRRTLPASSEDCRKKVRREVKYHPDANQDKRKTAIGCRRTLPLHPLPCGRKLLQAANPQPLPGDAAGSSYQTGAVVEQYVAQATAGLNELEHGCDGVGHRVERSMSDALAIEPVVFDEANDRRADRSWCDRQSSAARRARSPSGEYADRSRSGPGHEVH